MSGVRFDRPTDEGRPAPTGPRNGPSSDRLPARRGGEPVGDVTGSPGTPRAPCAAPTPLGTGPGTIGGVPQTLVTRADVEAARVALEGVVRRTPVEPSRVLAESAGGPVRLKCENLQRTGSFKIRGAYRRIQRLADDERARGVVAASAGNHAQGVALAAGLLGTHATVFMPAGAPLPKLAATRGYGADVRLVDTFDATLTAAAEFAEETGAVLIHPFDHPDIVAGQGTVGLEILEQVPDVATVVVCTGGGGLVSGIAAALAAPGCRSWVRRPRRTRRGRRRWPRASRCR